MRCTSCGFKTSFTWASIDCPECHRPTGTDERTPKRSAKTGSSAIVPLSQTTAKSIRRVSVGREMDDALGGGWPIPSAWTMSGPPGAGKTTGALKWAHRISLTANRPALFVSAEMSARLARAYVERLSLDVNRFLILESSELASFEVETPKLHVAPCAIVVDSVSRLSTESHGANTPQAIAATIEVGLKVARACPAVLFFIFHATKDGRIKSPSDSDHDVDGTIWVYEDGHAEIEKSRHGPAPTTLLARAS